MESELRLLINGYKLGWRDHGSDGFPGLPRISASQQNAEKSITQSKALSAKDYPRR
jgi:hypothetical protein